MSSFELLQKDHGTHMKILSRDPIIYTIDNYLTIEECNHIMKISDGN